MSGSSPESVLKNRIMKEINERKLDNMETKWTTFPSDIVFSIACNIKTKGITLIWNNEEPLSKFSMVK